MEKQEMIPAGGENQQLMTLLIEEGPQAMMANEERLTKVTARVEKILAEIQKDGMSDELDAYCNKVQIRIREVYQEMQDERKPLTSKMDQIKKAFTEMEAKLDPQKPDSFFSQIGKYRKQYAAEKAERERKKEEEKQRRIAKTTERNNLITQIQQTILNDFNESLDEAKQTLIDKFNSITLGNIEEISDEIYAFNTQYMEIEFNHEIKLRAIYHTKEEVDNLITESRTKELYERQRTTYETEISGMKTRYIDQLPGLRRQLEEEKRRKEEEEKARAKAKQLQREADMLRDEVAKAEAEERARIARENAEKEEKERKRLEDQRKAKEEEDRIRAEKEKKAKDEMAKNETETAGMLRQSKDLFDIEAEQQLTESHKVKKAKEVMVIEVKSQAGWMNIFALYFEHKGGTEKLEDLEKRTFKQMKAFCEKLYNDKQIEINSPAIEYVPDYQIVARK